MRTYAILTGILIHKFFSIFYPAECELTVNFCEYKLTQIKKVLEPQLINLGFNIMYYYSCLQICFNKIKLMVSPLLKNDTQNQNPKQKTKFFSIYKDGGIVSQSFIDNDILDELIKIYGESNNNYLLIISQENPDSKQINKIHYTYFPKSIEDYKHSNIRFFSIELTYNDETYQIELINNKHNHYIVSNILDKHFFQYYLTTVLKVNVDNNSFNYNVSIIDHNVNIIHLTPNDYLIIKEDSYEIVKTNVTKTNSDDNIGLVYNNDNNKDKDNDKDKNTEKIDDKSNSSPDNYNKNDKEQLLYE